MRSIVVLTVLLSSITLLARADFATAGADAERTGWVRSERVFNPQNVKNMRLLWRVQLDSTAREMHNLFPPLVLSNVAMAGGPKEVAVVAGISDDLWGLDTSTGATIWHRHFDTTLVPSQLAAASTICPGGQTALPVAGPGPSAGSYTIYAVSWDGRLWRVNAGDGADVAPAEKFMPPNAKLWSLNLANGVLYTGISEGCGGVSYRSSRTTSRPGPPAASCPAAAGCGDAAGRPFRRWHGLDGHGRRLLRSVGRSSR